MSFADIPETPSTFKTTVYTKIVPGVPIRLRILDKGAFSTQKHYIPQQRVSILCLGDETCPICQSNEQLVRENPDLNRNQIRGIIPRANRYMVNVYNRTMVKKSPSGNVVYPISGGHFPTNDPDTGELIANIEAEPLNRVEVLERGPTLFSQLNLVDDTVVDEAGNPKRIWNYDIVIVATGSGRRMTTNVSAYPESTDVLEISDEDKFPLEALGIRLSPDEIRSLVKGVSLRDIFEIRRSQEAATVLADQESKVSEDVQESIQTLFPEY